MSLVERAIKKMQQGAKDTAAEIRGVPGAGSQLPVYGAIVETGRHPVLTGVHEHVLPGRQIEINLAALRASGLLPPEHQERQIAQQYRQIKRPIVANATGRGTTKVSSGHLIMMASALPGEGKTFTAINLAFSLALERDLSVLLVDADVAKPHISRLFGLQDERGLLDLLQDRSIAIESLILPTNVPGLSVLPAGQRSENATELLASERMQEIVQDIGRFDASRMTLFDSPPLLLTTESQALAQVVGQIVVVVRAGVTSRNVVFEALSYLGEGKSIALVLNQSVAVSTRGYYYGYGYGESRDAS